MKYRFSPPAAPERYPPPPDRASVSRPSHTAALAIPGERTGVAAKLGVRRFFKVALRDTTVISFGSAVERSILDEQSVSSNPPVYAFWLLFFSAVLLCCCNIVHTWWVMGGLLVGGWYYYCLLYTSPSPRDKRQSRMPSSA